MEQIDLAAATSPISLSLQVEVGTKIDLDPPFRFVVQEIRVLSPIPTSAVSPNGRLQFEKKEDAGKISPFTRSFLEEIIKSADVMLLMVTSTSRTSKEQANAMYDKVASGKKDSYKAAGAYVQKVASDGLQQKEDRSITVGKMVQAIDKVGFINVSQHAGVFGLDVVDVALSTMTARESFRLLAVLRRRFGCPVYKLGHPNGPKPGTKFEFRDYGCFHIAVMQPEELERLTRTA